MQSARRQGWGVQRPGDGRASISKTAHEYFAASTRNKKEAKHGAQMGDVFAAEKGAMRDAAILRVRVRMSLPAHRHLPVRMHIRDVRATHPPCHGTGMRAQS